MAKLKKKQRNAEAEMYSSLRGWKTHKDYINYLRAIGEKTWEKNRHIKKREARTSYRGPSVHDRYYNNQA